MSEQLQPDLPTTPMSVDEYLAWAEERSGKFELHSGLIVAMSPEVAGHARTKGAVYLALTAGVRQAGLPCHVMPDGMTVRVSPDTAYEPDALIYCGDELGDWVVEVPAPVVIVEVISTSTRRVDVGVKLAGYFAVPSVQHYLILDPHRPILIHHARAGDAIATRILNTGPLDLDPPGLTVAVEDFYRRP